MLAPYSTLVDAQFAQILRRGTELVRTTAAERRMEERRSFKDRQSQERRLAGSEGLQVSSTMDLYYCN